MASPVQSSWITLIFVGTIVLSATSAFAQTAPAGVVTTLQGTATVVHAVAPQPSPLKFKDDVFLHDRITTGDNSLARILLGGKAIVTARERSVLTITEAPGTATIDLLTGKIAVAVAKEKMIPGESIEIRAPNAIAGVRGTVLIAETSQGSRATGKASASVTSSFTVLQGRIDVTPLDPLSHQPSGPPLNLGALERVDRTGSGPPRSQTITPEAAERLAGEFKVSIKEAPSAIHSPFLQAHIHQAAQHTATFLGSLERLRRSGTDGRTPPTTGTDDARRQIEGRIAATRAQEVLHQRELKKQSADASRQPERQPRRPIEGSVGRDPRDQLSGDLRPGAESRNRGSAPSGLSGSVAGPTGVPSGGAGLSGGKLSLGTVSSSALAAAGSGTLGKKLAIHDHLLQKLLKKVQKEKAQKAHP